MKNIAIVCDSSVSFTDEEIKKFDVYVVPNLIIHKNITYLDQVDITEKEVIELLKKNEKLTTSQANLGSIIEVLELVKSKNYDFTYILAIGSVLSGAYNSFNVAVNSIELENCIVIDTHSVGGPVQQGIRSIRQLNKAGSSIQEITNFLTYLFSNQVSYLFPKSLNQIVASGRLSKAAAKIASLLRIKPIVYLSKTGENIDKLGISRTDKKAFEMIIEHFNKHEVKPETHDIYLLDSDALDEANKFKNHLFNRLGEFKYYHVKLPAALALHAGVGAITIQWCPKIP